MTSATDRLSIRARNLRKSFGDVVALDGFSLDVWEGGIVTLLGPSGCGKTTALRAIAGFEETSGTIEIRGRPVQAPGLFVPPERRSVGMVFQDYALFPHMTVERNVAYGLGKTKDRSRTSEVLELVGLAEVRDRMPNELSGGQQQRVALARALAPQPDVILLDEPFSNLDASLRDRVRRELRVILTEARTTAVFVTHDQEEALATSDIVAVMRAGRVVQADTPADLYAHPSDPWIGEFLGDADVFDAVATNGSAETQIGTFPTKIEGPISVLVRPEEVEISLEGSPNGIVTNTEFFGHDQLVTVALAGGTRVRSRLGPRPIYKPGQQCRVTGHNVRIYRRST